MLLLAALFAEQFEGCLGAIGGGFGEAAHGVGLVEGLALSAAIIDPCHQRDEHDKQGDRAD